VAYRGRVLLELQTIGEQPTKRVENILHEDVLRVQVVFCATVCTVSK